MTRCRALSLLLTSALLGSVAPASWSQSSAASHPPIPVVCFGPAFSRRLSSQPVAGTSYVSGVSAQPQIDGMDTWSPLVAAYRKFILDTYGVDSEPICETHPSESYANEWLKLVASGNIRLLGEPTVVMTGWTWKPSAADTAPAPKRVERPGQLER